MEINMHPINQKIQNCMKKIIILNMLLAIAAVSFGQQNTPDQALEGVGLL
jgi:hypothetical protein